VKGREFTHQDVLNAPGVIVVNESMARFCWPKEDPVGRAIRLGGPNGLRLTVVGVVGDVPIRGLDERVRRQLFRPYTQAAWPVHEYCRPHRHRADHLHSAYQEGFSGGFA